MLPVLAASAAWAAALLGLGHLVARRLAPDADPGTTGLLGYLVLAVAGTAVHLVAPVGPWVAAAALLLGLAAFAWRARDLLRGTTLPMAAALLALLAALSALNGFPLRHYDMGLYWLQAVKWTTETGQVPGLATLHARLGFNSAWFTVSAMLEHPLAEGRSAFLATTTSLFFAGWLALDGLREAVAGRRDLGALLAASTFLLVAATAGSLGGHSPDTAAAVLAQASLVAWARALTRGQPGREAAGAAGGLAVVGTLLAILAATVKLSYGVLPLASAVLLLAHARWLDGWDRKALAAAAGALVVPWLAHGLLASGCPLFPSRVACLPVAWATPAWMAEDLDAAIRAWARAPGIDPSLVLGRWDWLPAWLDATLRARPVQLAVAVAVAAPLVLLVLGVARAGRPGRAAWWLWGVTAAGAASWFWLAPTPRFGLAWLLGIGLVPAAEAGALALARWPGRAAGTALSLLLLAACAFVLPESLAWMTRVPSPAALPATWPAIPVAQVREQVTLPGSRILVPWPGDQCWAAPRPCTPIFDPTLDLGETIRTYRARRPVP